MPRIKVFRKHNNLTQADLADYLNVSKSFISRVESGSCNLPQYQLNRLLNNNKEWDITALNEEDLTLTEPLEDSAEDPSQEKDCAELRKELEMLRSENVWLRSIVERLIETKTKDMATI